MPKKISKPSDQSENQEEQHHADDKKKSSSKADISQNKKLTANLSKSTKQSTSSYFAGVDFSKFWNDEISPEDLPTDAQIESIEEDVTYFLILTFLS